MDVKDLLKLALERGASDVHLTKDAPPVLRIDGELHKSEFKPLTNEDTKKICYSLMNDRQRETFEENMALNFSLELNGFGRCRVNIHRQRGNVEAAIRLVYPNVRGIDELLLPKVIKDLAMQRNGLVLVTGPVGVGKTTTLAAMVDEINTKRRNVILMIEDPIEYIHQNKLSIIKQEEVSTDTPSFAEALRQALRQDPNVIVVGEMRDLETIQIALTAAETGHLVIATLHTPTAAAAVDRVVDVFLASQQEQIRVQLASCLVGVISQQLVPRANGGRIVATEVMTGTAAVKAMIRDKHSHQLRSTIETSRANGMHTMDLCLAELYKIGEISYETATARATVPADVEEYIYGGKLKTA